VMSPKCRAAVLAREMMKLPNEMRDCSSMLTREC